MGDVIETLMRACGVLGIAPDKPFGSVQDFAAHVVQAYPALSGEIEKRELLGLIVQAVRQAERHQVGGVVECLKRIKAPSQGSSI